MKATKCILCDKPAVNDGEYLGELCEAHKRQVIRDDMVIAAAEYMMDYDETGSV